jgi:hypothetical protein
MDQTLKAESHPCPRRYKDGNHRGVRSVESPAPPAPPAPPPPSRPSADAISMEACKSRIEASSHRRIIDPRPNKARLDESCIARAKCPAPSSRPLKAGTRSRPPPPPAATRRLRETGSKTRESDCASRPSAPLHYLCRGARADLEARLPRERRFRDSGKLLTEGGGSRAAKRKFMGFVWSRRSGAAPTLIYRADAPDETRGTSREVRSPHWQRLRGRGSRLNPRTSSSFLVLPRPSSSFLVLPRPSSSWA